MNLLSRFRSSPAPAPDFSQDPVFSRFDRWRGIAPAGMDVDFLGRRTDATFVEGWADEERMRERAATPPYPIASEETFEWLMLLSSVLEAKDRFVMAELGAGYGRWIVGAACALRRARPHLPFKLIGVEAEPQHFAWMRKHFEDNGIDWREHTLIHAAVAGSRRTVSFTKGLDPHVHWGQTIVDVPAEWAAPMQAITLADALETVDLVDLVDMDIQGAELEVIEGSQDILCRKVRRVHIGTHSAKLERGLRRVFRRLGWQSIWDWPGRTVNRTPYGRLAFNDGAQTWVNPRLT